jgi:hypothetical protein
MNRELNEELKKELEEKYNDGYGFKALAKEYNSSYTRMRTVFKKLDIKHRKGRKVVTNRLRKLRSEKAKKEYETKSGWWSDNIVRKIHNATIGYQGYYYNRIRKKYVWLRSSIEYSYAKWLDRNKIDWDVEYKTYEVNGKLYKPDFFIFENGNLVKIVETKGYDRSRDWKTTELNKILSIPVVLIDNIKSYTQHSQETEEWKKVRLNEQELKQLK